MLAPGVLNKGVEHSTSNAQRKINCFVYTYMCVCVCLNTGRKTCSFILKYVCPQPSALCEI